MKLRWLTTVASASLSVVSVAYCAQYLTIEQAQQSAFPDADDWSVDASPISDAVRRELHAAGADIRRPKRWRALRGETLLGWFFVDEVIGKSEMITYSLAINADGSVRAVEVLTYRETHGGEVALPAWRRQFVGKRATDPVRLGTDIRNISGATLSSRHLSDGIRGLLQLQQKLQSAHE